MRTVFSSWAYGESGADLDRAEGTLVFALLAGIVPALLAWLLAGVGGAAMDSAAGPAAAAAPLLLAAATLVRWIGVGVLVLIVPVYAGLAIAQHRRAHGLAPELSAWALAEVYVASALAALVGFLWLT
jgi:hypothetical protein